MKRLFFVCALLLGLFINAFAFETYSCSDKNEPLPLPKVDERIELLSIVFRLAGNWEYSQDLFKDYVTDIHKHFDEFKDHPLIKFAKEVYEKKGVSYDAVMAMAIYIEQPPQLNPIVPFTENVPEGRWGKDNANKFISLLKQFYIDAKCEEYFKQHDELYKIAQERFRIVYNKLDISWYKEYYGVQPEGSLNIILGLGNGGGNYGPKVIFPDGKEDVYAIMGTWSFDGVNKPMYSVDGYLPTLIHEFNHSFVNHLIDAHEKELEYSGIPLFEKVKDVMKSQAYANWTTMMKEALVRASVIGYIKKHSSDGEDVKKEIKAQTDKGFFWIAKLVDLLEIYETNRNKYPTLDSFMPRIIYFYDDLYPY